MRLVFPSDIERMEVEPLFEVIDYLARIAPPVTFLVAECHRHMHRLNHTTDRVSSRKVFGLCKSAS